MTGVYQQRLHFPQAGVASPSDSYTVAVWVSTPWTGVLCSLCRPDELFPQHPLPSPSTETDGRHLAPIIARQPIPDSNTFAAGLWGYIIMENIVFGEKEAVAVEGPPERVAVGPANDDFRIRRRGAGALEAQKDTVNGEYERVECEKEIECGYKSCIWAGPVGTADIQRPGA
ncbi:uncharacterized protein LAJ45_04968 [Morchella importuna]|uniref:uncharacterized protein n=1 Tax=Morchella importuna TaxID=1174673 RepID=UPI001E8EEB45|nr:uncharacterized protein LAJ45_04968 [Morchella importuna]KAH8150787.1 hypothetical protein LAJ45_04968 [Morchella importuna]